MTDITEIARRLQAAREESRQLEPISAAQPELDLAAGYSVLELCHRARVAKGASPVGRKIGFTNAAMWDRYGVRDPIWGYVYDDSVIRSGQCSVGRFTEPRIEPEIIFHFRGAPPPDPRGILASIDWVAHGFELVQSPFPGWKFQGADAVAAGSLHAALVVGEQVPLADLGGDPEQVLRDFTLSLLCNGEPRETGKGSNVLGNPLAAVAHLIALLQRSGHPPLQAGELVTTGTITAAP
ncbi:MAG TPA: fumarylacetoacetate hydrolase family protein, partial [Myxococcales bacterium]|nr:fumarylacetoacetate hydrolase family protein [Myxococcales bacterium]